MRPLFKKNAPGNAQSFPPDKYSPAVRSSICTGERTAGFKEKATGKFIEVMKLEDGRALEQFRKMYGVTGDIETIY